MDGPDDFSFQLGPAATRLKAVLDGFHGAVVVPSYAPRGTVPLVLLHKVMGKMFAILSARSEAFVILKTDPDVAEALRDRYACVGDRSHLDRRFWISIELDADMPAGEIEALAARSYDLVIAGLTRKQQEQLRTGSA